MSNFILQPAKKGDETERKISHDKGKAPPPPTVYTEKGPAPLPPVNTPPPSPSLLPAVNADIDTSTKVPYEDIPDMSVVPLPPAPVMPPALILATPPPPPPPPPLPVLPVTPDISFTLPTSPLIPAASTSQQTPAGESNIVLVQSTSEPENIMVVSSAQNDNFKPNTSTITITGSELTDTANSLATNISQVTVVTTHPPVLIDNTYGHTRFPDMSEVVIVANETNKTQINESSTDEECFPSLDSLECPPPIEFKDNPVITDYKMEGQKLDESEVLIVNSSFVSLGDSGLDGSIENSRLLDTTHVSVVTVGEDNVKVKDSASVVYDQGSGPLELHDSTSDLSAGRSVSSSKSDSGDEMRHSSKVEDRLVNGNVLRTNVHKASTPAQSFVESRSQSENSSVRSNSSHPSRASKSVDHSDVESISTASQDSRGSNKENMRSQIPSEDEVILRKKPVYSHKAKEHTRSNRTKEDIALHNLKKKTRKRTRKFEIDGVVVTTTTSKVIYGDDESGLGINEHIFRKQELRELKMLQKQEQKQFQDLSQKEHMMKEHQDKKFEQERVALERTYENDLEMLSRQQRQQVERAEAQQEADLRLASKKIRAEQERDLKQFREGLKQELRLLKTEIDMMPKDRRKNEFRVRKEKLESEHEEREKMFLEKLNENHETSLRRLSDSHRERIALMDRQFLQQKQQLMRGREAAIWELEEKQIHEKHQLAKRQLKDIFFLQRHQMLVRHEKELEQVKRMNQRKEEELLKRQAGEKRSLPKRIRAEMKAREMMFRESMRISISTSEPEAEREKLKKVCISLLYQTK